MKIDERRKVSNKRDTTEMIKHMGQYTMRKKTLPVAIKTLIKIPMILLATLRPEASHRGRLAPGLSGVGWLQEAAAQERT